MLKIGFHDFNASFDWITIDYYFLKAFRDCEIEYKLVDPILDCADIVFKGDLNSNKNICGNPFVIGYTDLPEYNVKNTNVSLSFYNDNENNLYYPVWQIESGKKKSFPRMKDHTKKDLFCSFVENEDSKKRDETYLYICTNYKSIISCGEKWSNAGYVVDDFRCKDIIDWHERVKFNLCFEPVQTSGDLSYISQRIINAYDYGVVPIYWGCENITKWFNPESFINCNGLSNEEILNKIIEINNNEELYSHMLYSRPFNIIVDWKQYSEEKLIRFLKSKNVI